MLKFKRVLHQGMRGRDVAAVKIALGHAGFGTGYVHLHTRRFGPSMKTNLKRFQRHKKIKADGVYGPKTHTALTPSFSRYARWLYSRQRVAPPVPQSARAAAQRLLELHADGKFRDDRGTVYPQLVATAAGRPVMNAIGQWVHIDARPLEALVWLIDARGHREIGSFALCSDHHYDGPHGHAGGLAVDISSIDGLSVNSGSAKPHVIDVLNEFHAGHVPWQLISGGYAGRLDSDCYNKCIPSPWFYGVSQLYGHCNHVHVGYR